MRGIVVGFGEVGRALARVLNDVWPIEVTDKSPGIVPMSGSFEIMHVCFPYFYKDPFDNLVEEVKRYQKQYGPKYTVIHSTVAVGTSRLCGAIHSPVRGMHPDLTEGIKKFVKFIGGENASEVADYFRRAGMRVMLFDKPETTEAMKLFDTEYYRACIEFAKRVKRYCDKHDLNFHEVYTLANETYNLGYYELGHQEFMRPVLQPIMTEKIGGHCVMPNSELIKLSEEESGQKNEK